MKKIIIILFFFLSFFMCYLIYKLTEDDKLYFTSLGDTISINDFSTNINNISTYNTVFTDKDCHLTDLLNTLKYNQEKELDGVSISLHQILKKTDILILSIGMNDIYYKLNDNTKDIYTYLNTMLNNYDTILEYINHYDYQEVYVLGYYNITSSNQDIYTYINYKLERMSKKYHYTYLNLNKVLHNNPKYLEKPTTFYLNNAGKQEIIKLIVENLKNN